MRIATVMGAALVTLLIGQVAHSRDERVKFPIEDAMKAAEARVGSDVKFFFGAQTFPQPVKTYGTFTANKKTNFANKSDKEGCEWAFMSALLSLKERALREGGNAVVNIKSAYKNVEFVSDTEYECGAGAILGGVALRGDVVKLP